MAVTQVKTTEVVRAIAADLGLTQKVVAQVLESYSGKVHAHLASGVAIAVPGVGKLIPTQRAARVGHNPKTREKLEIPATKAVRFSASNALKVSVKG